MISFCIRNVGVVFPSTKVALKDVSFTVTPGQLVAILGHNGSGKGLQYYLSLMHLHSLQGNPHSSFSSRCLPSRARYSASP